MAASTDIKWFRYKNKNAPQITNNWGAITPVLDACLVTGFSEQVVKDVEIKIPYSMIDKAKVVFEFNKGQKK